jgi:hypothetical protein
MAILHRALLTSVLLLIAARVFAQPPSQFPPMRPLSGGQVPEGPMQAGPPPLILLASQKSVQAELKLKRTQTQRIQSFEGKMKKAATDAMQTGPQGMMVKMESVRRDSEKELAEVLSEEQMARLNQIAMQLQGPQALLAPEAAEKLQLTKEQSSQIRRLTRKDEKKVNTILTEEQRAKWQEMVGQPFHGKIAPPSGMPLPRN